MNFNIRKAKVKSQNKSSEFYLDKSILTLNSLKGSKHSWTVRDSLNGTQIFGATGSGKSSGSGLEIAKAFLNNGYGGLVLCAKTDERKAWDELLRICNRENDKVVFDEKSNLCFDPILYESRRTSTGGGEAINIVDLLMNIYEVGTNFMAGANRGESERYWDNALRRLLLRSIDLLLLLGKNVTIPTLRMLLTSALNEPELSYYRDVVRLGQLETDPAKKHEYSQDITELTKVNYLISLINEARLNSKKIIGFSKDRFRLLTDYFLTEFNNNSNETKQTISEMILGLVDSFSYGILRKHFVGKIDNILDPKLTYDMGKIIILDFPIKHYLVSGVYAQSVYKYIWQQSMERRKVDVGNSRPVFLWIDECQYFINPKSDTLFQTTARGSIVATVYITQNINNYYNVMGHSSADSKTKSLLGNLSTKIFHANSDFETNKYACEIISKVYQEETDESFGDSFIRNKKTNLIDQVLPYDFTVLKAGGKGKIVEAIIFTTAKIWGNKNFVKVKFKQQ